LLGALESCAMLTKIVEFKQAIPAVEERHYRPTRAPEEARDLDPRKVPTPMFPKTNIYRNAPAGLARGDRFMYSARQSGVASVLPPNRGEHSKQKGDKSDDRGRVRERTALGQSGETMVSSPRARWPGGPSSMGMTASGLSRTTHSPIRGELITNEIPSPRYVRAPRSQAAGSPAMTASLPRSARTGSPKQASGRWTSSGGLTSSPARDGKVAGLDPLGLHAPGGANLAAYNSTRPRSARSTTKGVPSGHFGRGVAKELYLQPQAQFVN